MRWVVFTLFFFCSTAWAGGSRLFDGSNDYISVSDHADFDFAGDFTLMAWVNLDATTSERVIYKYDSTSKDGYYLSSFTGSWTFAVFVNPSSDFAQSAAAPSTGVWTHVTGVRDSDTITLYVDGVAEADTENAPGAINSSGTLFFGVDLNIANDLNGEIADVRAYNRALSQNEIDQAYRCLNKPINGLVGHWLLWDEDGTMDDLSGSGHDGTNTASTTSLNSPPTSWCSSSA
jgi:hypothetical protein